MEVKMKKGRSTYCFQVNCDSNTINQLIGRYLSANGFTFIEKNGENFYKAGDAMAGYRGFSYSFANQILNINAWVIGLFGKEYPLDANGLNASLMNYNNSLNILFQEIANLNNGGMNVNNQYPQNNMNNNTSPDQNNMTNTNMNNMQQPMINNANQFAQNFQTEANKKKEQMAEMGFWISVIGLFSSFFGVAYGIFIYAMDFYFASQGLQTRKRGKAIATIVLSIISIIIIIFELITA
jgi:hypothetical protein